MQCTLISAALFSFVGLSFGCDYNPSCVVKNEDDLIESVRNEHCVTITAPRSSLTSFDAVTGQVAGKRFVLERNAELSDVSGADGARFVGMSDGGDLAQVDLTLDEGLSITDTRVNEVALELTGSTGRIVLSNVSYSSLNLRCIDCAPIVVFGNVPEDVVVVPEGVREVELSLESPIQTHEFLHGLGTPKSVTFRAADQDEAVMVSYRTWLDGEGFAGVFEYCPYGDDDGTCREIAAAN